MAKAKKTSIKKKSARKAQPKKAAKSNHAKPAFGNHAKASAAASNLFAQNARAAGDAWHTATENAKKAQSKAASAFGFSLGGSNNFAKSADDAAKKWNDAVEYGKDNFEAVVEAANIASRVSKEISAELSSYANNVVAEHFKAFEEFLSCKTVSDFLDLQSSLFKSNIDSAFNESLKIGEMAMEMGKAIEPVTERVQTTVNKIKRRAA